MAEPLMSKGRAFIIGNGPSLAKTPMEKLIGETSFALNKIHLMYDKTPWRPQFFVSAEDLSWDEELWREAVTEHLKLGCVLYLSAGHRGHYTNKRLRRFEVPSTRIEFVEMCEHTLMFSDNLDAPSEWHLPRLCNFGSTLHVAIQVAIREGYGPLYLVGCDLGYKDGEANHFDPAYEERQKNLPAKKFNRTLVAAHKNALKSSPVPIYNATLGGFLEIYPRVDLLEVLNAKGNG